MSWINYLLEANLYLVLFYAVYYFVLRKDTYYQLNRIYLLTSSLFAFVIPLMQLGILKPAPLTTTVIRAASASAQVTNYIIKPSQPVTAAATINYYLLVYIAVAMVLTIALGVRLWQLVKLAGEGKQVTKANFKMIEVADEQHAFSFFNYLFIGSKLSTSSTIIKHELVHIRQKHSIDIIYLEVIKIICWFNPVVYLLQNSIKEVHEFIADSLIAAEEQDVNHYTDFLISNAYGLPVTTLTNNFFNKNLLKNRIMMLHQKKSGSLARLKYLVALPLLAGMLCLSTLGFTKDYGVIDLAPAKTTIIKNKTATAYADKPFTELTSHINNNIKDMYVPIIAPVRRDAHSCMVTAYFKLNTQGQINDVKLISAGRDGLGEPVYKALASFNSLINYKPGEYYLYVDWADPKEYHNEINDKPAVINSISILDLRTVPAEIDKFNQSKINSEKYNEVSSKSVKTQVETILSSPSESKHSAQRAVDSPKKPVDNENINTDTITKNQYYGFYKFIGQRVRYPAIARTNNVQGKVLAVFNINDDKTISNVKIVRGLMDIQNDEVVRVIKLYTATDDLKPGINYTIPVSFGLQDENGKYAESEPYKAPKEYVNSDYRPNNYKIVALGEVVIVGYKK